MARKEIELFSQTFPTKSKARDFIRSILHKYEPGQWLCFLDDMDIWYLLHMHPEFREKEGVGIHGFTVETALYGGRCFYVHRTDGTSVDFSFETCLKPPSVETDFHKACRTAVRADCSAFKQVNYVEGMKCPITEETLTWQSTHADHAPPWEFVKIVKQFIADEAIDINAVDIPKSGTGVDGFITAFGDSSLAEKFRVYHNERAVLRLVSKTANLSHLKKVSQEL